MKSTEPNNHSIQEKIIDESPVQERLFSGSDMLYTGNGNVHPIEFKAPVVLPKMSNIHAGDGLEPFFNAIDYLNKFEEIAIADLKVDVIPTGKPFSYNENGGLRKYALVTVKFGQETRYIVEVERLKKIYLSTLIIELRSKKEFEEQELYEILGKLLVGLIRNYGNWDKSQLQDHPKAKIHQVKHLENWSVAEWAIVLFNRLGIPEDVSDNEASV